MIENDVLYVTPEGLQQLKDEIANLKTVRREEIAQRLAIAIKQGDLKENADYHDAKEEQAFIEARIRQLDNMLGRAKLIEENGPSGIVRVGSTVTVAEEGTDDMETYKIVGAHEADPTKGLISNESPIGSAMLGAKKGQTIRAMTPAGAITFVIHEIS
jgi:transcription elongation factor GreA